MRGTIAALSSLAALVASTATTQAKSRAAHPQPTPSAMATLDPTDAPAPDNPENAAAKAKQDALNDRIQRSSERALRSVCQGCTSKAASVLRPDHARREADADAGVAENYVVDEADEAPPE